MALSNLISVLFSIGVALSAFGALYQPVFLGYLAASPGILIVASTLIFIPYFKMRGLGWSTLLLLAWGGMASLIGIAIYGLSTNYLAKMISLLMLTSVWLSPLFWGDIIESRHLRLGLIGGLVICFLGLLAIDLMSIGLVREFAFSAGYQTVVHSRIRGFMQETSHFAHFIGHAFVLLYLVSSASKTVRNRDVVIRLVLLSVLLGLISSRGSAISVLVALLIATIGRHNLRYLLFIIPFIFLAGAEIIGSLAYDIDNFTSAATRSTLWLASTNAILHNPFGYGYYGFYGAVQEFGRGAIEIVNAQTSLITTELVDIVEELNNVSTKTTIMDFGLVFGLPFFMMIWRIVKRINISDVRARAALVYFFLSALSTSGHQALFFFLGLSVLAHLYPRKLTNIKSTRSILTIRTVQP